MWFGDLVTMTLVGGHLAPGVLRRLHGLPGRRGRPPASTGTFVDFAIGRKASGVRRRRAPLDPPGRRRSPRRSPTSTRRSATSTRSPTPRATRRSAQLVTWLGDDDFLAGVNAYLARHRFGNATLADFVDALDARHRPRRARLGRGVAAHDRLRHHRGSPATTTGPVLTREGSRPHRLRVTSYDDAPGRASAPAASTSATSRCGSPDAAVVVPNSGGETFARLRLDEQSWAAVAAGPRLDRRRRHPRGRCGHRHRPGALR